MPVALDDTNDIFTEVDNLDDGESALALPITNSANQPVPEATTQSITKADIQPVPETEQLKNISAQK